MKLPGNHWIENGSRMLNCSRDKLNEIRFVAVSTVTSVTKCVSCKCFCDPILRMDVQKGRMIQLLQHLAAESKGDGHMVLARLEDQLHQEKLEQIRRCCPGVTGRCCLTELTYH